MMVKDRFGENEHISIQGEQTRHKSESISVIFQRERERGAFIRKQKSQQQEPKECE